MVEEADKKDEPQVKFDSAGQAVAYISLDQAGVLALPHARDNREIYGRYSNHDLVWAVTNSEETEDYYEVTLPYRPARGFRGRAGLGQFIIDKMGPIEFRQILSEPKPSRSVAYVMAIAIVLAATGATLCGLFASGVWSTPTTPRRRSRPRFQLPRTLLRALSPPTGTLPSTLTPKL